MTVVLYPVDSVVLQNSAIKSTRASENPFTVGFHRAGSCLRGFGRIWHEKLLEPNVGYLRPREVSTRQLMLCCVWKLRPLRVEG